MMFPNKRGQDVNPVGAFMGLVGAGLSFYMAGTMGSGFIGKSVVAIIVGIAMYFLATKIMTA